MTSKRLFLLRHADAMRSGDGDINRALSPKGKSDAVSLGKLMSHKSYRPDVVLCSPALRTRQTLEGLRKHIDVPSVISPQILYNGSAGDYLYEIQKISDENNNILMVAHNPSIYELVILLAAQGSDDIMGRLSRGYPPATLSIINCKCDKWAEIQPVENELANIISP